MTLEEFKDYKIQKYGEDNVKLLDSIPKEDWDNLYEILQQKTECGIISPDYNDIAYTFLTCIEIYKKL